MHFPLALFMVARYQPNSFDFNAPSKPTTKRFNDMTIVPDMKHIRRLQWQEAQKNGISLPQDPSILAHAKDPKHFPTHALGGETNLITGKTDERPIGKNIANCPGPWISDETEEEHKQKRRGCIVIQTQYCDSWRHERAVAGLITNQPPTSAEQYNAHHFGDLAYPNACH